MQYSKTFKRRSLAILLSLVFFAGEIFAAAPVINSITPETGYNATSTEIAINGANFEQNSKVYISSRGAYVKGSVDTPSSAIGVCVLGNYAYVADEDSGLQIIDISNPTIPSIVGSVDTPDFAYGVYVLGNYAYIADGYSGLQVIHRLSAGTICETNFVDNNTLTGDIPAGLIPGQYNIKVVNSSNESGILHNCFTVVNRPQNSLPLGNIDINSPGSANRVDGHDLYVLSRSFGSVPSDSNWNILADLDENNIIDGNDLVILAGNFGKKK